jgi:surface antigen
LSIAASPVASASQTDCLSYAYTCTPGYNAINTEGSWAWAHYGGQYAVNANGYHNCTLYAAWQLEQNGMADPGNWGNAVDWINHTSYNQTPAVGSIAWWGSEVADGYGHVAYVDQVSGSQVHVIADNYVGPNSDGYTSSGWIAASSVDEFLHPHDIGSGGSTAGAEMLGIVTQGGQALTDSGGLNAPWMPQTSGVSQIAVASDGTHGPLLAVLTDSGQVLVKEGSLSARWTTETSGVSQIAVASDATHGPLLAVLTDSGQVLVKEGSLSAPWASGYGGVAQVAAAG